MSPTPQREFHIVLIKPAHYDDDGYPIQWYRSAIPSNTLACLNGLAMDAQRRDILGPDVAIERRSQCSTNNGLRRNPADCPTNKKAIFICSNANPNTTPG